MFTIGSDPDPFHYEMEDSILIYFHKQDPDRTNTGNDLKGVADLDTWLWSLQYLQLNCNELSKHGS